MSPPDKFFYLLNDDNTVKKLSDLQTVRLSDDYFNTHNEEDFKAYIEVFLEDMDPDKNENSPRSIEAFRIIVIASERIKGSLLANRGKYDPKYEFLDDLDEFLAAFAKNNLAQESDTEDATEDKAFHDELLNKWAYENFGMPAKELFEKYEAAKEANEKLKEDQESEKDQEKPEKDQGKPKKDQGKPKKDQGKPKKDQEKPKKEPRKTKKDAGEAWKAYEREHGDLDKKYLPYMKQLEKITLEYKNSSNSEIASKIYDSLMKEFLAEKKTAEDKITAFYVCLLTKDPQDHISYLERIKRYDKSRSAAKFVAGIASVFAIIITLPISLILVGVIYSKTGRHPLDLLKTYSEQFNKELNLADEKASKKLYRSFFDNARDKVEDAAEKEEKKDNKYRS